MADASIIPVGITGGNTWDAGGGTPGQYSASVWDVINNGINQWSMLEQQSLNMDYKRWESQNGILTEQGSESDINVSASSPAGKVSASMGTSTLLLIGGLVLFFLMERK